MKLGEQVLTLPEQLRDERTIGAHRGRDIVVGIRPEDLTDAARRQS